MKRAIILHGTRGEPSGNWFPWLKSQLEARGLDVWVPALPRPEQPSLRLWSDYVHTHAPFPLDEVTTIVGHSSGAILALIVTQENTMQLGAVVGVSVFRDNSLGWEANNNLFDVPFDFAKIKKHAAKLLFIHSDNDPYVPLGQAKFIADSCNAELTVISGQGHFNLEQSENYREFPNLLEIMAARAML